MKIAMMKRESRFKGESGLYPVDGSEYDLIQYGKIPAGNIMVDITKKRMLEYHRYAMGLLQFVYNNQSQYESFDDFRYCAMMAIGETIEYKKFDGSIGVKAKSVSFDSMDETAFRDIMNRLIPILARFLGITDEQLKEYYNSNKWGTA